MILKEISIEKVCAINDELERIYYITYSGDPFYLVIDDLKGRFKYSEQKKIGVCYRRSEENKNL